MKRRNSVQQLLNNDSLIFPYFFDDKSHNNKGEKNMKSFSHTTTLSFEDFEQPEVVEALLDVDFEKSDLEVECVGKIEVGDKGNYYGPMSEGREAVPSIVASMIVKACLASINFDISHRVLASTMKRIEREVLESESVE